MSSTTKIRLMGLLLLVANFAVLGVWFTVSAWQESEPFLPFVWRDLAVVHCLAALPLAVWMVGVFRGRFSARTRVVVAAMTFAVGAVVLLLLGWGYRPFPGPGWPLVDNPWRTLVIFPLALAAALAVGLLFANPTPLRGSWFRWIGLLFATVVCAYLPWHYLKDRCVKVATQVNEHYPTRYRLLVSKKLTLQILALDWWTTIGDELHPDEALKFMVEQIVEAEADSRHESGIDQAVALARLDRLDEALAVLDAQVDANNRPVVETIRGEILEVYEKWEASLAAYRTARQLWQDNPDLPKREVGLRQTSLGIAGCLMELGQYPEAESEFDKVVAAFPHAVQHCRFAEFYERTGNTERAIDHAQKAVEMSGGKMSSAKTLLRRLGR